MAPVTMLVCPPGNNATVSSLPVAWGKVWGCQALKFAGSHPLLLHQPEMSPPCSKAPGDGAPVVGTL